MLATKVAKFGLVGIINTIIDFGIYNVLTSKRFKWPRIRANIASTTTAMIFSFFANKQFVFSRGGNVWIQAMSFYAVTAFGLYVLQNLVIHALSKRWQALPNLAVRVVRLIGLKKWFHDEFVRKNTTKLAATAVSLTWNFLLFQYVVFR